MFNLHTLFTGIFDFFYMLSKPNDVSTDYGTYVFLTPYQMTISLHKNQRKHVVRYYVQRIFSLVNSL